MESSDHIHDVNVNCGYALLLYAYRKQTRLGAVHGLTNRVQDVVGPIVQLRIGLIEDAVLYRYNVDGVYGDWLLELDRITLPLPTGKTVQLLDPGETSKAQVYQNRITLTQLLREGQVTTFPYPCPLWVPGVKLNRSVYAFYSHLYPEHVEWDENPGRLRRTSLRVF